MKYIPIPGPVTVCDIEGNPIRFAGGGTEEVNFEKFVLARLTDSRFSQSMHNILIAVAIRDALKAASDGFVALEDEHYGLLREITENPSPPAANGVSAAYPPGLAHNLVPFMKAIVHEAKDKKPGA